MEGIKTLLMKAKKLLAVDPTRLYTRQEVATMFALTNIELFSYVSLPDGLRYETVTGSPLPQFRGSELIQFFSKTYKLCQDGCPSMKTI
ncbi:hypothetical protein [uncultured Duncaniella sp.]|jgi:hypothetical protein|uniref:hypothetical protein n=1 Tax=uncultured Duncaniella sp. TaxID=2768039 RepID=UPI003220510A